MKKLNFFLTLSLLLTILLSENSCKKEDVSNENNELITVTDIDGNTYHGIKIGSKVWMVENLRTTKFNDGANIPIVTNPTEWSNLSSPAYCYYSNSINNSVIYGNLYNWYAINSGKLSPQGWHVATKVEWESLITYLGGENIAGGKLKEIGLSHWRSPNVDATNEVGFTALPGGLRDYPGGFYRINEDSFWWSSTEGGTSRAWHYEINFSEGTIYGNDDGKRAGYSVRCVKD